MELEEEEEEMERVEGGGTVIRIYYIRKNGFSIKGARGEELFERKNHLQIRKSEFIPGDTELTSFFIQFYFGGNL